MLSKSEVEDMTREQSLQFLGSEEKAEVERFEASKIKPAPGLQFPRPDWDHYFLGIARAVAARADCRRAQHGAVLVDPDNRIKATGYNAAHPGGPSCLKGECPRGLLSFDEMPSLSSYDTGPGTCVALHAEQNCLLYASFDDRKRGTLYITGKSCDGCAKMIRGSGLARVVWEENSQIKTWTP